MAYVVLFLGLVALLVMLFRRTAGAAMMGSVLSLAVACLVVVFFGQTPLPETLGLLYLALAVGIWAATPPPEEGAETLGDGSLYVRAHKDPGVRASLPEGNIDPDTGDSLTAYDHLWLAGLPFVGWILIFLALPKQMAFLDGVFLALLTGTPGEGFTLGVTDISALFGLLLIYPGDTLVLALPVTGLVACLVQAARGRPTAFAAFMEYGILVLILNIIALVAIPWR